MTPEIKVRMTEIQKATRDGTIHLADRGEISRAIAAI